MDISKEKSSLLPNSDSASPWIYRTVILIVAILALIFAGMTYSKVSSDGFCGGDTIVSTCTFKTVLPLAVLPPTCGGNCRSVIWSDSIQKAENSMSVLTYLLGPIRSVKDSISGNYTLLSSNNGAINAVQPLLCNYTAITNVTATVFQFYEPGSFFRVATTVPTTSGEIATCTYLSSSSAAYPILISGGSYSGVATLFGEQYYTIYNPIFDALTPSKLIGCLYIGVPL